MCFFYVFLQKTQEKPVGLSMPEKGVKLAITLAHICALRKVLEGIRTSSCFAIFALLVGKCFGREDILTSWTSGSPGEQMQLWGPSPFKSLSKFTFRQNTGVVWWHWDMPGQTAAQHTHTPLTIKQNKPILQPSSLLFSDFCLTVILF